MSRTWKLLTMAVLPLLFVTSAACGGDGGEKATQTPTNATAVAPTQVAPGTPVTPTFPGPATASVTVGEKTFTFKDGRCDKGPDDAWLAVNIGQAGGDEYFGLVVGNPAGEEGLRPAKGGGVFTDGEIVLGGTQGGSSFTMAGAEGDKVTVAADLKSGEFEGTTIIGKQPISGSFKC